MIRVYDVAGNVIDEQARRQHEAALRAISIAIEGEGVLTGVAHERPPTKLLKKLNAGNGMRSM
jgi:hypothetical protein